METLTGRFRIVQPLVQPLHMFICDVYEVAIRSFLHIIPLFQSNHQIRENLEKKFYIQPQNRKTNDRVLFLLSFHIIAFLQPPDLIACFRD